MEPYNPEAPAIRSHWGSPQRGGHQRGGYHSAPPRQRDLVSVPTEPEPSLTSKEGDCVCDMNSADVFCNLPLMIHTKQSSFLPTML